MTEFNDKVEGFKRELVAELLLKCTDEQQLLFKKIYESVYTMSVNDLHEAYDLCYRTVKQQEGR